MENPIMADVTPGNVLQETLFCSKDPGSDAFWPMP
jgi:hypothetical protein